MILGERLFLKSLTLLFKVGLSTN